MPSTSAFSILTSAARARAVNDDPAYLDLITKTLEHLGPSSAAPQELRIFKLKHANVEDRSFTYRDRQVTQPGVATMLRNLVDGADTRGGLTTTAATSARDTRSSGTPTPNTPGSNGSGVVVQYYVEASNVNVAEQMVLMIQTQRAYELNAKVVSTSDAMLARLTQL